MRKAIILFFLLLFIPTACEFISFDDYRLPSYDGDFIWTQAVKNAEWSNRLDHAVVVFKGKLWVIGGYNPGERSNDSYLEDVWSSSDGYIWDLVTDNAPWKGRRGHTVSVFYDGIDEALFLIGGFTVEESTGHRYYNNDVWKSVDGLNWVEIKVRNYPLMEDTPYSHDWFPRMNHATLVANHGGTDYLYIIGGSTQLEGKDSRYSMVYFNDVWRSVNGVDWDSLELADDIGIRAQHAATVDPATQRIFVQGGIHGVIFESDNYESYPSANWRELWSSIDGINWIPESDTSQVEFGLLSRSEHSMIHFNGSVYGLPGKGTSNVHFQFANSGHYPTWKREAGNIWSIDSEGIDIDARYAYASVIFENKVWILGGDTNSGGPANDIWFGELK